MNDSQQEQISANKNLTKKQQQKVPPSKKERDDEYAKDHEVVRGVFRFHEVPGGRMTFVYKKHKGDEVMKFDMYDGQIYSVPRMVAKHLNKNCWYPIHTYEMDEFGKFTNKYLIQKKVRRCSFQSLEFIDDDDITPVGEATIYTAHNIGN